MAEKSATMIELAIVLGLLALVLGGIAFGFGLCFLMFMVTFHPTEKRESGRRHISKSYDGHHQSGERNQEAEASDD